ncbi:MAG: co-chaperone GroES [Patescibacteria group bacterium]|nr:co-chaperone GroES [Patescibacteria group bacterium]
MNLKPLYMNVIVKPLADETITKFGIVIPDTVSKEKPEKGEVVAVGEGRLLDNGQIAPLKVKVGDKVMFKKYSPEAIKLDDQEYLVIKEQDIMLIFE